MTPANTVRRPPKIDIEAIKVSGVEPDLERLEREGFDSLTPEEHYRLKMQGVCTQRTAGLHMIRIRIPGGKLRAAQLRGLAALSADVADGGAHITTRQNLELHDVPSTKARHAVTQISALELTTRSTCGHTVRNVMGCTLTGICPDEPFPVEPVVQELNDFFLARADYYNQRLPRRINVYVAGCTGCMSHAQMNDLGFVACRWEGRDGFQLWCAGSFASNPRLAHLLFGFVPADEVVALAEAVTEVYIEHGFRDRAAKARMKFLLAEWGEDRFADAVLERLRAGRPDARTSREGPAAVLGPDRRAPGTLGGAQPQKQEGFVRLEAHVPLGDLTGEQMGTLADLADRYADGIIWLTREQNAELHWIPSDRADDALADLEAAGLRPHGAASLVDVQVCAGTEWCVWGVADSRGIARDLHGSLTSIVAMDRAAEPLRVHISGCSHGCAQHGTADVGLAAATVRDGDRGTTEGFEVFGGGRLGIDPRAASRLGKVPKDIAPEKLVTLLVRYVAERTADEDFASFLDRTGAGDSVRLDRQ